MKLVTCLLAILFGMSVCAGQTTITATDVAARLTVGNTLINRSDTLATTAAIGAPGTSSNSWNFSSLATHLLDTLQSVNVASTPYAAFFPGSTHALRTRQTLQGITGTVYQYLKLGTSLLNPGAAGDGQVFGQTAVLRISNTPNTVFYQLPMTLGTSWTTAYVESLNVTVAGIPFFSQATSYNVSNTVDAFGTLTLPGSFGTHQALRIRSDSRSSSGRSISYQFIAANGASVQLTAADTLQPSSGTINIDRTSTGWSGPVITDVAVNEPLPVHFGLMQNYPNPFNPATTIGYQVAETGPVSVKVYDVLGRDIATLVNEVMPAGVYAVTWNAETVPSGVYFCRMQSGSFSGTKRMMVLK